MVGLGWIRLGDVLATPGWTNPEVASFQYTHQEERGHCSNSNHLQTINTDHPLTFEVVVQMRTARPEGGFDNRETRHSWGKLPAKCAAIIMCCVTIVFQIVMFFAPCAVVLYRSERNCCIAHYGLPLARQD